MTTEEIFSKLSAHSIRGMMVHDQLSNYYDFLGLSGFKRCHEYHYLHETHGHSELNHFYISRYNKLVEDAQVDSSSVIPANWYKYMRQDVDASTKREAVEVGLRAWVDWEHETKAALREAYKALSDLGKVSAAEYVCDMIRDNDEEIKAAEKMLLDLEAVNYDMTYIVEMQDRLHKKYKKKLKTV